MPVRQALCVPPALLRLAEEHHDLLRTAELRAEGLSYDSIKRLVRHGVLHELHAGVLKVGTPTPSADGRRLAAVYAAGPGSAVSHRDAAQLCGLALRGRRHTVDVTTRRGRADRPGVTLHRVRRLDPADVMTIRAIRVTTRARTFVDLADVLSPVELRRVMHEAEITNLLDLEAVRAAMRRAGGRDLRAIRAAVEEYRPRSSHDVERRLAGIAWRAGLRGGQANVRTLVDDEEFELDRYYPHLRLCLEADGYAVHKTRRRFNADRRRDRILRLRLGITTFRYTWDDVTVRAGESQDELADYAAHVVARGQPGSPDRQIAS